MSATDLLVEVGDPGSATTLSSPGYTSGSSTSINVASTSNWPSTGKAVIFAIDEAEVVDGEEVQVAGTYNEYEGTVASATSVSNVAWQRGSGDRNYSAGSLTRVYIPVSAERENRLVEWGEHEHDVNGNHDKEIITDRTAATPATGDSILLSDADDSDNLKKSTLTNLGANGSWMDTGGLKDGAVTSPKLAEAFFRGRMQSNTTNSAPTGLTVQFGWGYITGDGTTQIGETVTFPAAFSAPPVVLASFIGADTGNSADSIDDFDDLHTGSTITASCPAITSSQFTVRLNRSDSAVLGGSTRWGYSWIAIGTV